MPGVMIAISCSLIWSFAIVLFKKSGDTVHPVLLNLFKNSIGLLLFIPTVFLVEGPYLPDINLNQMGILVFSGMIGIGAADAMVLKALKQIGASRLAIIECAYSPCVILLSLSFLGEKLTPARLCGAALVVLAILCVSVSQEAISASRSELLSGMLSGILGILTMAVGIVMVKPLFSQIPLFWVITIRLAAGVFGSGLIFLAVPNKRLILQDLWHVPQKKLILAACVLSTYVSMMLWVAGYKFNDAALAAVLNQTSTIFTVVLAAIFLKEKFTLRKAAGTALAMTGVMIMAFL